METILRTEGMPGNRADKISIYSNWHPANDEDYVIGIAKTMDVLPRPWAKFNDTQHGGTTAWRMRPPDHPLRVEADEAPQRGGRGPAQVPDNFNDAAGKPIDAIGTGSSPNQAKCRARHHRWTSNGATSGPPSAKCAAFAAPPRQMGTLKSTWDTSPTQPLTTCCGA